MNRVPSRRSQQGYLYEAPLILVVLCVGLALVLPHLSTMARKIVLAVATVPVLFCFFYLIVAPGWKPGMGLERRVLGRWSLFLGCAAVLVAAVAMLIFR